MKKMIVYAPSYASLSFILSSKKLDEIHVITPNNTMIEFCEVMNISHQKINSIEGGSFQNLKSHKKYIYEKAKEIHGENIFFGFYGFDIWGLYFIKLLDKKNKIFFLNLDFESKMSSFQFRKNYMRKFLDSLIYRFLTGLHFSIFRINEKKFFLGIDSRLLSKKYDSLSINVSPQIRKANRTKILNKINIPNTQFIFVDQGSSQFIIDDNLISRLSRIFKKSDLIIKEHPNHKISNKKLTEIYSAVPTFTPLECIVNENVYMIGVASTAMFHHKSISLINLVNWQSIESKNRFQKLVEKYNIPTPENLEKLQTLISEIIKSNESID